MDRNGHLGDAMEIHGSNNRAQCRRCRFAWMQLIMSSGSPGMLFVYFFFSLIQKNGFPSQWLSTGFCHRLVSCHVPASRMISATVSTAAPMTGIIAISVVLEPLGLQNKWKLCVGPGKSYIFCDISYQ